MTTHRGQRPAVLLAAVMVLGLVALLMFMVLGAQARFDAATGALLVTALGLLLCLRALYGIVTAVARPGEVARTVQAGIATQRELREEKRRLVRAIKELQFDYELGKLSETDYKSVREGYELRAVEVMRALDQQGELRPELAAELQDRGIAVEAPATAARSGAEARSAPSAPMFDDGVSEDAPTTGMPGAEATSESAAADASKPASMPVMMVDEFDDSDEEEMATVVRRRCPSCDALNYGHDDRCSDCGAALS